MGARTKLNVACINGCLLIAALLGLAAGSWSAFPVTLGLTIACGFHAGEIRLSRRAR